ncbi:STAS domain-containing protein [Streptomyces tanashiensis]|uniref:Anti-sigma factor antagonist n=2 Tax=Streptomyces tanashiensis TaxID=67367 RepID=A0ABY6RA18_9ACTN|nr:STAS domain-containing protein [Streptomyces tanashiensis]UZX25559.1 STAS domain-containing protein [Streptomyces tanashiensis]
MSMDADSGAGKRFAVRAGPGTSDAVVVLGLVGELDHDSVGPLTRALDDCARARRVVVDCSGLTFCDSTGLNELLRARLRLRETGGRLDLAGLGPPVDRMFEITGARLVFRVYADTAEALADDRAGPGGGGEAHG